MNTEALIESISELKRSRRAIILGHNYQPPIIQDISDFVGDSLGLSQKAAESDAEVIVFCGVDFMAETAAILAEDRLVLIPEERASCPMAHMATGAEVRALKAKHPGSVVVTYVNSTAEVKAESDICCTSANAVSVLKSIPTEHPIIFAPDMHLGEYAGKMAGREVVLWEGFCPAHHYVKAEEIRKAKEEHPNALVMAHPECPMEVIELADAALSTSGMLDFPNRSSASEFIVVTEVGMLYPLRKRHPGKKFYCPSAALLCPNMKMTTLESVKRALESDIYAVRVSPDIARRARIPIERMLAVPRD
ncbi:MAG: quinolinate synthase NadA [Candidatus Coatesbacteria bacterium]|nr:quinolinate synthase NadA [Candidatus Coatesbacteria bacterium]